MANVLRVVNSLAVAASISVVAATGATQSLAIDTSDSARGQVIDGFGTCISGGDGQLQWWQDLYFDDLQASILRWDLTPRFKAPYSDRTYNSPWFHEQPGLPGPDGTNAREYTGPNDYSATWNGYSAPIAVMGPDIDGNAEFFDFEEEMPKTAGVLAQIGVQKRAELGDFKLIASLWSPAPWLKVSSGNRIGAASSPYPVEGTSWPFVWAGNFAGGRLDVSDTPLEIFDDGTGPTSALTQFARGFAAYLYGFQKRYDVRLYAVSIQNELNFEVFYNSCTYPLAQQYVAALKAARAELDKHPELKDIRIMGPEDLLGGNGYALWQYGGGDNVTHKNLQYLKAIAEDPEAARAIGFFNIHGYAPDGVSSAGASPQSWLWWANGWTSSPAAGLPAQVQGFKSYGKKSWMTETSGEETGWLAPSSGFPADGAFSIALKIHQALTAGEQSAWVYWQLQDSEDTVKRETLTDSKLGAQSPKYVAFKHFARTVRPNSVRVGATVTGDDHIVASAFVNDVSGALTSVLVNTSDSERTVRVQLPAYPSDIRSLMLYTSSSGALWQESSIDVDASGTAQVVVPGYGVVSIVGDGEGTGTPPSEGGSSGSGGTHASAGGAGSASGAPGAGGPPGTVRGSGSQADTSGSGLEGSCGCRVAGRGTASRFTVLAGCAAALLLLRRRRSH